CDGIESNDLGLWCRSHRERTYAIRLLWLAPLRALKALRAAAACPSWARIAEPMSLTRPSCRSLLRKRTPQSGAVRICLVCATVSPAFTPIWSPRAPMSWTRKSENGWNVKFPGTPLLVVPGVRKFDAVARAPVLTVGSTWQFAQPVLVKSGRPALI